MAGPNAAKLFNTQRFPIYYPGRAQFVNANGDPSGAAGSTATATVTLNTRPHALVGLRIRNVYQPPAAADAVAFGPLFSTWRDLKLLDVEQDITLDLAQQSVIIRAASQSLITGPGGSVWHPFACPYPFRGGNNIVVTLRRNVAYPLGAQQQEVITPTVELLLFGYSFVKGNMPPGSPPSSEYEEDDVPD